MQPYFYTCHEKILSKDFEEYLIKDSFENLNSHKEYRDLKYGLTDGNRFRKINEFEEIQKIINSLTLQSFPVVLMHKPFTKVTKHIDDQNKRNCVLSIPLYPKFNYPPTYFWKQEGSYRDWQTKPLELLAICNFENMMPTFLNTQIVHSLETFDSYRFNLQFCFNEPFEYVVDLYKRNLLFTNN